MTILGREVRFFFNLFLLDLPVLISEVFISLITFVTTHNRNELFFLFRKQPYYLSRTTKIIMILSAPAPNVTQNSSLVANPNKRSKIFFAVSNVHTSASFFALYQHLF